MSHAQVLSEKQVIEFLEVLEELKRGFELMGAQLLVVAAELRRAEALDRRVLEIEGRA